MPSTDVLNRAIQAAREGRKIEARDLLIRLVEIEPDNEWAWIWLSGLFDSVEDRIIACENVLSINPTNEKVRAYLAQLRRRQAALFEDRDREAAVRLLNQAKSYAERNENEVALDLARQSVEKHAAYEEAWLFIGKLSSPIEKQMEAFERAYQINPLNKKTAATLEHLRYLQANPLSAARRLEQLGRFEDASKTYQVLAAKAKDSKEFDLIDRKSVV